MNFVEKYILQLKIEKRRWRYAVIILTVLSLIVALVTIWNLRMTGVTIANDATCGYVEHQHTEECPTEKVLVCGYDSDHVHTDVCYQTIYQCGIEEHIHTLSCYSDPTADVETAEIWESTLPELTGNKAQDIVLVAQSQIGYKESEKNYVLAEDGETKLGITRYGQWYGNPYGEWANMFTSFCLRNAGLTDVPINSGAEVMRVDWEKQERYEEEGQYNPVLGDIVFLDKNDNNKADTTAVILSNKNNVLTVIEGNTADNTVAEITYSIESDEIIGYGITAPESNLKVLSMRAAADESVLAQTITYSSSLLNEDANFIIYVSDNGNYYAIDGNANAVEIQIDADGGITSDISDANLIYWTFEYCGTYDNQPTYYIRNISTGKYLHPYHDNDTSHGAILSGRWESAVYTSDGGVKFRGARQNAYVYLSDTAFTDTGTLNNATTFYFGKTAGQCTVWFDGTNGGLMSLMGSENKSYSVEEGDTVRLPSEWLSPGKYHYTLRGWYDVKNSKYYAPGTEITVSESLVFYADWISATYDIGRYNSHVANTVSTKDFITANVFDYNMLFNVLSQRSDVSVNSAGHTETWQQVVSGNVPYKDGETLDFDFLDYDGSGDISYPNNRGGNNASGDVYSGLYSESLGEILFATNNAFDPITGSGIIGKYYVGTADHLFQKNDDPTDEHYGYYYYDSKLNAASYNQSDGRFYVYDYLERTSDSEKDGGDGGYSDFLPFNSPYANTNGKTVNTYNYGGEKEEYANTVHYQYDAKYDTNNNSAAQVTTNYSFGMSMDINFFLPNKPGYVDSAGVTGNRDIYGKEMHFYFSGDDDVWVLLDGEVVLDIGGVHGIEGGDINFSTGVVTVNDVQVSTLEDVNSGEHTLTVYYLERGSSQSNCSIYFNLAPRFALSIQKEDVLTGELLNGAQFSVYSDSACTVPCELWKSEEDYNNEEPSTNTFTVENGVAMMWGLGSSNTYYIRETHPPNMEQYTCANGIICLTLDKNGIASYSVEIIEETDEDGNVIQISNGFTVHGFNIDEETQEAFIAVTNAQEWVKETTSVQVEKKWDDEEDHTYDSVTVYLNVTDVDGTVRRIREITLSEVNGWKYSWTNLPKYLQDGETEVQYSVSEAYVQGYTPHIEKMESGTSTKVVWSEAYNFSNGETYVLSTSEGFLSAVSTTTNTLCFVDENTAKESSLALWTATVSGNYVKLVNQEGQVLSFNYASYSSRRYFYVTTNATAYQNLTPVQTSSGVRLYYRYNNRTNYYLCSLNSSDYASASTSTSSAITFNPLVKTTQTTTVEIDGFAYAITNIPLENETSLTVTKKWEHPTGNQSLYEKEQVTIKLLANGVDTGRTVTLSLKNGWTDTFLGLPYNDNDGNIIVYTIEESWQTSDWIPIYDDVIVIEGDIPSYKATVTNTYRWGTGEPLPTTGGIGVFIYILCGLILVFSPLVYGFSLRRRYERRSKH